MFMEVDHGWGRLVRVVPVQRSSIIPVGVVCSQPRLQTGIQTVQSCRRRQVAVSIGVWFVRSSSLLYVKHFVVCEALPRCVFLVGKPLIQAAVQMLLSKLTVGVILQLQLTPMSMIP